MTKPFVWDTVVRLTHWTVAVLFLSNYFVTEEGSDSHEWVGYVVLATIAIRLLWGLITKSPARLTAFKPSISNAIVHLMQILQTKSDNHQGHNPAGAIMIWTMWFCLIMTGLSGWSTQLDMFWGGEWVEELHEFFANFTMLAVTVHISAVIFMTHWTKRSYVKSMLFNKNH